MNSANDTTSATLHKTRWFVNPRPAPEAATRLFLFPYAGAGPAAFAALTSHLPNNVDAWTAHYPGRGSRHSETQIDEVPVLVEQLAEAIRRLLDRPFALLGHSFGGLVAFELARRLRAESLPGPAVLVISACSAPHLPNRHAPLHSLPDADFIDALRQIRGIPSELLGQPDALGVLLPALRADFTALETYVHNDEEPLDQPVIVIGGRDDPRVTLEELEAWKKHTSARFEAHFVSGDHFFIHSAPRELVQILVPELRGISL